MKDGVSTHSLLDGYFQAHRILIFLFWLSWYRWNILFK